MEKRSRGGVDGKENYTSTSIDALATSVRNKMEELLEIPPECCIYRVPLKRKVSNKKVYTPQVVSIGPFHCNKKELQGMEEHKLRYMKVFLTRTNINLDDFISVMTRMEKKARNSYFEKIDLSVDEFVKILIIDSFFIFENIIEELRVDPLDQAFYLPNQVSHFKTDLVLLENQIPFFVLDNLFNLAFPQGPPTLFLELCIKFMASSIVPIKDSGKLQRKVVEYLNLGHEIKHFVDLLRIFHLPSTLRTASAMVDELISMPNAVQLQEAGVQLLKVSSSDSLLDIKFSKGVLEIPVLIVQECFELVMSNILILERCHYSYQSYIGHYAFFMQMLVDTDKDVDLLIHNGIIEDWLGKNSIVAELFHKVGREAWIYIPSYYLYDISKSLNAYCNVTRHKWKAAFRRDYCSSPWMIASTIAAVILLTLTFLSTIASFLAL
ncbi:hypothetical protein LguiA_033018 [Lonicera macranthoides]